MTTIVNEFAVRPELVRRAVAQHKTWIEQQLGVPLSDVVILESELDIAQVGIELLLAIPPVPGQASSTARRLRPFVLSASTPPEFPPFCDINKAPAWTFSATFAVRPKSKKSNLSWADCPIALRLRRGQSEFSAIALNVAYHTGPGSDLESTARLIVARRENASVVVRLFEELDRRDNKPRLHVVGSSKRQIVGCKWDDLVLDYKIRSLLKDDFESFFEREAWFRANKLPFRRGYLLHGPPGNGKSTAVRAMMTSRGLTAYTMPLFTDRQDDYDLNSLFDLAIKNRPSMVLLEDLDRAFPRTGETKSRISLQALLNALDGVGTGEGIIVVATANEPAILDPAILRRPGRFDRVVHFPNPCAELRCQYLQQLNPSLPPRHLKLSVEQSDGLSFAQLREVHVIAGQRAFERKGEICEGDLLIGIRALQQSNLSASRNGTAAGFLAQAQVDHQRDESAAPPLDGHSARLALPVPGMHAPVEWVNRSSPAVLDQRYRALAHRNFPIPC